MSFSISGPLLDFCVLALVEQEDTYGYELTQRLIEAIDISESTMYPVLRRLSKNRYLETYDKAIDGRNRRYYRITPEGIKLLKEYELDWETFKSQIDQITGGDEA